MQSLRILQHLEWQQCRREQVSAGAADAFDASILSDADVTCIVAALTALQQLRTLLLARHRISPAVADKFTIAVAQLSSLRNLAAPTAF